MKKVSALLLSVILLVSLFVFPVNAFVTKGDGYEIEYLDNGDYIITYIEDDEIIEPDDGSKSTTVTKTKTSRYYNSSGATMWYVKVQGTFTYNGTTSTCNSAAHKAAAVGSTWSIISASHSKSGNKATATATARHYLNPGYSDYTRSVTLKCSPTGVFT